MNIFNDWIKDIPEQYHDKKKIETLLKAFSKQMNELSDAFNAINKSTSIDEAQGVDLDYIGNIVSLVRKDIPALFKNTREIPLDDSLYRQAIKYKALRNTCECTYEDIIASLSLLWKTEQLSYSEPKDRSATICIRMEDFDIDIEDPAASRTFAIKPAGVMLIYYIGYLFSLDNRNNEHIKVSRLSLNFRQKNIFVKKKVQVQVRVGIEQKINNIKIMLYSKSGKHNLWYLDGKYLLNGERTLNATHKTEEI